MTQKLLLALPAALSLAACGGGGGDEATTAPAQAQYSLHHQRAKLDNHIARKSLRLRGAGRDKCHLQSKNHECGIQTMECHAWGA